jgi:dihydrofolate reductase
MKRISSFMYVSVDGYYAGPNGEIDWFHSVEKDPDFEAMTHQQARGKSTLLMGRITYEMMKSFWPTPDAERSDPGMAEAMRNSPKIVISKSLRSLEEGPHWKNLTLLRDVSELQPDNDITILGSGSIVQQLTNLGRIDEYNLVIVPVVLGAGKALFKDVHRTKLQLREAKSFRNGLAFHTYSPA